MGVVRRCSESLSLRTILEQHFQAPAVRTSLRSYIKPGLEHLSLRMKVEGRPVRPLLYSAVCFAVMAGWSFI